MASKKKIELTLTAAVGIAGKIIVPGKNPKVPDCAVDESVARNLLHRGKATLFGSQELDETGVVDPADTDSGKKNGFPPPAPNADQRSGNPIVTGTGKTEEGADKTPGAGSGPAPAKDAKDAPAAKDPKAAKATKGGKA